MKKKQKQHNPQKQTFKDVEYLQKKLGEEKENLVRQNKKLQKQIHQEIQENRLLKASIEKKQKAYEGKIQQLRIANENLQTQLLLNEEENNNEEQFQIKLKQTRDAYKGLHQENQMLKQKLEEYAEVIAKMQEDINELQKQNSKYKRKIKDDESQIKNLAKQMAKNKQIYTSLEKASNEACEQLNLQIEQNSKLEGSLAHMKKKNKQFNAIINELQEKIQLINKKQHEEFQYQLNILRKEKQELQNIKIQRQSKISFLEIADAQKNQYIDAITKQLHEIKNSNEFNTRENTTLSANLLKVENQNRRLQIEQEKEKSRVAKEMQQLRKSHEEQLNKVKRKTAEEVTNLFKSGSDNKVIQNYIEGLKSHKSQMNLRGGIGFGGKIPEQKLHIPFEKLKYEHEISNLSLQIQSLKKNLETTNNEIQNLRKTNEQIARESQNRSLKIKELNFKVDSLQNQKRVSEEQHYKELIRYRNIQTEMLQNKRNYAELEQATTLKINYYDKKIKEYIDGIDRKDSIIENLRNSKVEAEGKTKFMEEKLVKCLEEVQALKKFKNDTSRKDQLLKDYKEKVQKCKSELESLKTQLDKVKKQKTRLQRNLQSKQEYINTLKARNHKQQQQKQSQIKQEKSIKELKQKYEGKLKKLKKQLEDLEQIIEAMRSVIAQKIQQAIRKSINQQEPLQDNWEGAAVLGLKSSEIEEFVNPTVNLDRNICQDLDGLWESRRYEQFMRSSIQYILLKNQRDLPQFK